MPMSGTSPHLTSMTLSFASGAAIRMSAPRRDLQTAAEAVAVNRSDHRCRHQRPVVGHALSEVRQPVVVANQQHARAILSAHEARDVQAGAEALAFPVKHDGSDGRVGGHLLGQRRSTLRTSLDRAHCAFSARTIVTVATPAVSIVTRTLSSLMRGNDTSRERTKNEPSTFDARPIRTPINTRSDSTDGQSYSHSSAATAISTEGGA